MKPLRGFAILALAALAPRTSVAQAFTYELVHSFSAAEGASPRASLVQGADGRLYGTTSSGGAYGFGTAFSMGPSGELIVLHSFGSGDDGAVPWAALIQGSDGAFYGTTLSGGEFGGGTAFRMAPTGEVTVLHSFGSGKDGDAPGTSLVEGAAGSFYGTTVGGGSNRVGTLFRMDSSGRVTILHSFDFGSDGNMPESPLIRAFDGSFYGTTRGGGACGGCYGGSGGGTVFRMSTSGHVTILVNFGRFSSSADATLPEAPLAQATDGEFYGMTYGATFRMNSSGEIAFINEFGSGNDDKPPGGAGGLIQGEDGNFIGTRQSNFGTPGYDSVFEMDAYGSVTILHSFGSEGDGKDAASGLIRASDGSLYGTTFAGGAENLGTIFRLVRQPPHAGVRGGVAPAPTPPVAPVSGRR